MRRVDDAGFLFFGVFEVKDELVNATLTITFSGLQFIGLVAIIVIVVRFVNFLIDCFFEKVGTKL